MIQLIRNILFSPPPMNINTHELFHMKRMQLMTSCIQGQVSML